MATRTVHVPFGEEPGGTNAAVQRPWRNSLQLSSIGDRIEAWLESSGFDRGPWLTVAFAAGIAAWFVLDMPWQWLAAIGSSLMIGLSAAALWRDRDERSHSRIAVVAISLAVAFGLSVIWARSETVGAVPLERPTVERFEALILEREDQPARERIRLILAMRDAAAGKARKLRINVPLTNDDPAIAEGATIRLRARLMPPASPMLPGAYDFARTAWFAGYSATGSLRGRSKSSSRLPPMRVASQLFSAFCPNMCGMSLADRLEPLRRHLRVGTGAASPKRTRRQCAIPA